MSATELLTTSISNFIRLYLLIIFVRIILSWFQTAGWAQQALEFVAPVTDPYLNIFRSFVPPLGGIDFSPILATLSLVLLRDLLGSGAMY